MGVLRFEDGKTLKGDLSLTYAGGLSVDGMDEVTVLPSGGCIVKQKDGDLLIFSPTAFWKVRLIPRK